MQKRYWLYACLLTFSYSCVSIKPENLKYNATKRLFEYGLGDDAVTLRNESKQLIDSSNIEAFQIELQQMNHHYPFSKRQENDVLLRKSDYRLAQLYSNINIAIQNENYAEALNILSEMRRIYPAIDYYSDCLFLEGYTYEKLGFSDNAAIAYVKFNTTSSQKYSGLFRGHHDTDSKDSMYIAERHYAYQFLNNVPNNFDKSIIHPIKPKFYYTSYQPGFTINPEDFSNKTKFVGSLALGRDLSDELSLGFQISYRLTNAVNLNTMAFVSSNTSGFSFSMPIQLYKSESNNFGIKLSPFVNFTQIDSLEINGTHYFVDDYVIDFGAKISAACYINQKFYIGTYYQYNYYNENNRLFVKKPSILLWTNNEYDISGYYTVLKNLSLKVGVKNSELVAGVYLSGLELSYNLTNPGFILRTDIF